MIAVRQVNDLTLAGPLLARALAFEVGAGPEQGGQLVDLVGGCCLFELWDADRLVGAFAARRDSYSDGAVITVTAAGGLPGYDLTSVIDAWAQLQAVGPGGARALTCTTRRPGLVKKLKRAGYQVAGYVMRKEVAHGLPQ
ncbi:hypothetical protein [Roseateles violae]|uniref:GNAT family N-acetyltransferase n=1 Tax=Roseateles violae TaxID=3058042 RepID=A0ABT8DXJ2_9BURK|nr:hypothetical protein [Pelomonas sp. PFR6]MDN3921509.1 hypothetical protein [Pelomonas sp. PFR6]